MSLYVNSFGRGEDLVLLHGWGFNGDVWGDAADQLAEHYTVHLVDLPGFGRSPVMPEGFAFQPVINTLLAELPEHAMWLGWSMGGLFASGLAMQHPERVSRLVLVGSNAQFIQSTDWPNGVRPELLDMFAQDLETDFRATIQRFLMLNAKGSDNARDVIKGLRQRLFEHGEPALSALRGGLQILRDVSLVNRLSQLTMPCLLINGRLDALVPVKAAEAMAAKLPCSELKILEHAAHLPFVSHPNEFVTTINQFVQHDEAA